MAPEQAILHESATQEDDRDRKGGLPADVVFWAPRAGEPEPIEVHGVIGDSFYYSRHRSLLRHHLERDAVEEISSDTDGVADIAIDGADLFWVSHDCQVSAKRRPRLGGECLAEPVYLFVDETQLYIFARKPRKWRQSVMTLYVMPRSGGIAREVVALENFERIGGPSKPLFDGQVFYTVDLFGNVFRLKKHGTTPSPFGKMPILRQGDLQFYDEDAVYWTSGGALVRAPKDRSAPARISKGGGSYALSGDKLYRVVQDAIYVSPRTGGRWQRIAGLPSSSRWELWVVGAKLYAYNYDVLLRIDPNGTPTRELIQLEVEAIQSLSLFGDELFYVSTDEARRSSLWSVSKRGGTPRQLFEHSHFAAAPLVADAGILYLAHDGLLHRRSLADLRDTTLASRADLAASPAIDPARPDTSDDPWSWPYPPLPKLVVADDSHVFWADAALGMVASLAKAGGSPRIIAKDLGALTALAVDQRYAYVVEQMQKATRLIRYEKSGGEAPEVLATTSYRELPFAVVDNGVLWATRRSDALDSDVDVFGLMKGTGFRSFGQLRSAFEESWFETPLCDFAVFPGALHSARCSEGDSVVMSRSFDDKERILATGFTSAGLIVADSDAVYFAELGDRHLSKGIPATFDCCSIWVASSRR